MDLPRARILQMIADRGAGEAKLANVSPAIGPRITSGDESPHVSVRKRVATSTQLRLKVASGDGGRASQTHLSFIAFAVEYP